MPFCSSVTPFGSGIDAVADDGAVIDDGVVVDRGAGLVLGTDRIAVLADDAAAGIVDQIERRRSAARLVGIGVVVDDDAGAGAGDRAVIPDRAAARRDALAVVEPAAVIRALGAGALNRSIIGQKRQDEIDIHTIAVAAGRGGVDSPRDGAVIGDDGVAAGADTGTVAADDVGADLVDNGDVAADVAAGTVLCARNHAAGVVVHGAGVSRLEVDAVGARTVGRDRQRVGDDLAVIVDREVLARPAPRRHYRR